MIWFFFFKSPNWPFFKLPTIDFMSRAKLSENQHRITAKIIQMCLPSSKIWNLILISDITLQSFYQKLKYTLFQWFRWVSLVLRVYFGLIILLCQIQFKESVKVHCRSFCAKTKKIDSEHIELNHYQDNFRSPSIIIKVNHCQSSIPQPLIGLNRSQLAVRERRPTANCATRNFQLFSSRGQPIPHKHHHWC